MKPVVWIVGGSKGLGVMIAKGLAEDGYRIAMSYRNSKKEAERLKEEMAQRDSEMFLCQGDASDGADVRRMAREIMEYYGKIDVLICTAGPFIFSPTTMTAYSDEQWHDMVHGNLSSVFYCTREVIPIMRQQLFGRVITFGFAEIDQLPTWDGYGAYAAAKSGVASLTRTLSKEEAGHGITVNMVCPGDIRDPYKEASIDAARREKHFVSPVGRAGSGEDVARVVRFLCHADSDFITGAIIPITGGFLNPRFTVMVE